MDREELKKAYLSIVLGHLASGEDIRAGRCITFAAQLTPPSEHCRGVFYLVLQWTEDMGLATSRKVPDGDGIAASVSRITPKGLPKSSRRSFPASRLRCRGAVVSPSLQVPWAKPLSGEAI